MKKFILLCVCVFSVFYGVAHSANVLIVGPSSGAEVTNLRARLVNAGGTVDVQAAVPSALSGFQQIWDVRYNTDLSSDQTAYLSYLTSGGSLFLMGENVRFATRNNSIKSLLVAAGAGSVGNIVGPSSDTQVVNAPFNGPTALSSISYFSCGALPSGALGTGSSISAASSNGDACAAKWGPGNLANALTGTVVAVYDVNFLDLMSSSPDFSKFTDNLIAYLASTSQVGASPAQPIPTLTEWAMIFLASLMAMFGIRRMRRNK